ncbi:MAG: hypothetical protein CMJ32_10965 [Phycisphaerae bacterium]|nr:hypothetical protein [Phycisphaerae bacterium]
MDLDGEDSDVLTGSFQCGPCGREAPYNVAVARNYGVWVCRACDRQQKSKTGPYHPECFRVADRLRAYYSSEEIGQWIGSPHPQLGGETPQDVINAGRKAEVHAIIDRLDSDNYL